MVSSTSAGRVVLGVRTFVLENNFESQNVLEHEEENVFYCVIIFVNVKYEYMGMYVRGHLKRWEINFRLLAHVRYYSCFFYYYSYYYNNACDPISFHNLRIQAIISEGFKKVIAALSRSRQLFEPNFPLNF